jgi:hypothetical protein
LLQNHGKLEKAKQLTFLLGLKQVGEFLEDDDDDDDKVRKWRALIQGNAMSLAKLTSLFFFSKQLLKILKLKFNPSGYRLTGRH